MKSPWTFTALILSAVWIFYNSIFSGSILYFDALGYEQLGKIIAQGKLTEYFSQGPNREPLYPIFVALNMRMADLFQIPYLALLLLTQGLVLLSAQLMMAGIFRRIGLSDRLAATLLIYFIISPTVLRSCLIEYSEIVTFPLMLLPCWAAICVWQDAKHFMKQYWKQALFLGISFVPIVFVKGIFEMIAPMCIFIFVLALSLRKSNDRAAYKRILIFAVIALGVFMAPVNMYKAVNFGLNGNFTFTNRGSWALYGTSARRVLPTTLQEDAAQKWYVWPDKDICVAHVGPQACAHWFYALSDQLGMEAYTTLKNQGMSSSMIDHALFRMSIRNVLDHPIKTLKGMFWEGSKLLFWEYPSWGMVILPRDVRQLYDSRFAYVFFLYVINNLNVLFFLLAVVVALRGIPKFFMGVDPALNVLMISLMMIVLYIATHSLFFLNERNALPIVPIFLILYGSLFKCIFSERKA